MLPKPRIVDRNNKVLILIWVYCMGKKKILKKKNLHALLLQVLFLGCQFVSREGRNSIPDHLLEAVCSTARFSGASETAPPA